MSEPTVQPSEATSGGLRWNIIVGVLSLLYGVIGTLFWSAFFLMTVFWKPFMKAAGLGEIEPPAGTGWNLATGLVLAVLGIVLAIGGAMVLARRARGGGLLRFWAFARLLMIVLGLVMGLVYMSEQVDFAIRMNAAQRDMIRDRGGDVSQFPEVNREQAERQSRYMLVGFAVVSAAFPLFIAIVMTSPRKREEMESWNSILR